MKLPQRVAASYAGFVVRRPGTVLLVLLALTLGAIYGASRLGLNTNQLDLISQDLQQVKDVQRIVDMVGGTGYLMLALRGDDETKLKAVADGLAVDLSADTENVRFFSYKLPIEFIQENMVLFVSTDDLQTARERINAYVKAMVRANNPFAFDLGASTKKEPAKLEIGDIVDKYSRVGKKSILDEYHISQDKKMLLLLVKPMWNAPDLGRTEAFVETLRGRLAEYAKNNKLGVTLVEDYRPLDMKDGVPATGSAAANQLKAGKSIGQVAPPGTITYGFTGSYKTILDDSVAVRESLKPTSIISFLGILAVMIVFFRKVVPIFVIASGTVLGTLLTIGFAWVTVGELNMITSMLGAILMGLGVDFGFHFTYRTRLELGQGKRYDEAIRAAIINAGVPAFISAIATSGAFFALLFSGFRGFSQFGFLAGFGTFIIGLTLFSWSPAILALIGRRWPDLVPRLIGVTAPPKDLAKDGHQYRIPKPKMVIAVFGLITVALALCALPLGDVQVPKERDPTLWERIQMGVRFNYNTRALMPEDQPAVMLQDEINVRFNISSDPIAVYTRTLEEAKKVFEEFPPQLRGAGAAAQGFGKDYSAKLRQYSTVDQVVSPFTFVPPPELAKANAAVLAEWKAELEEKGITVAALPPELQEKGVLVEKILSAKPYGIDELPDFYRRQFMHLPTTRPENHGWLTFIYPTVDLYDGKNMLLFAEQTEEIRTADGSVFRSAGLPILYATLAKIVLLDGKVTVALTAVWLLVILLIDFRSLRMALASLIPLTLGMGLMFGMMVVFGESLNFMNICVLPIVLGYGVSHGVYLLHRFLEGTSPVVAFRSVGAAVASSTLTTVLGFGALLAANHNGLKSLGVISCIGLVTTLFTSFTLLAAVLQLVHDRRVRAAEKPDLAPVPAPAAPPDTSGIEVA
jgi:predicted RND superfamily exporter protein